MVYWHLYRFNNSDLMLSFFMPKEDNCHLSKMKAIISIMQDKNAIRSSWIPLKNSSLNLPSIFMWCTGYLTPLPGLFYFVNKAYIFPTIFLDVQYIYLFSKLFESHKTQFVVNQSFQPGGRSTKSEVNLLNCDSMTRS